LEHVVIDLHVPPLGGLDELEQREEAATNHNGERGGSAQTFEHAPQVPLNDMLAGSVQPEQVGGKDGEREDDQGYERGKHKDLPRGHAFEVSHLSRPSWMSRSGARLAAVLLHDADKVCEVPLAAHAQASHLKRRVLALQRALGGGHRAPVAHLLRYSDYIGVISARRVRQEARLVAKVRVDGLRRAEQVEDQPVAVAPTHVVMLPPVYLDVHACGVQLAYNVSGHLTR